MKINVRKILGVMLLGVVLYGGFAIWRGIDKMGASLASYHWWTFGAACALAFGNYTLRFFKWEFYLARLGIDGVKKSDSFLTFLSGFVIAQTQTTLEYVLTGAMAKVSILLFVIVVLYFRPNGLFSSKVRQ